MVEREKKQRRASQMARIEGSGRMEGEGQGSDMIVDGKNVDMNMMGVEESIDGGGGEEEGIYPDGNNS